MSESPLPSSSPVKAPSLWTLSARTAGILLLFTVVFTALMAATYQATRPILQETARQQKMKLIDEVLPPSEYDNDPLTDAITLPPLPALGTTAPTSLLRARKQGQPVALLIEAVSREGYGGEIQLLLALRADGHVQALRVTRHRETPGLGDYIDPKKDKDKRRLWIDQFNSQPAELALTGRWKIKKDGGVFDARAGATISARAVTLASGRAVLWVQPRLNPLFALPTGATFTEEASP